MPESDQTYTGTYARLARSNIKDAVRIRPYKVFWQVRNVWLALQIYGLVQCTLVLDATGEAMRAVCV